MPDENTGRSKRARTPMVATVLYRLAVVLFLLVIAMKGTTVGASVARKLGIRMVPMFTSRELDVNVTNRDLDVTFSNYELDVNVTNRELDVNIENSELDVNFTNRELDVNVTNQQLDVAGEYGLVDWQVLDYPRRQAHPTTFYLGGIPPDFEPESAV